MNPSETPTTAAPTLTIADEETTTTNKGGKQVTEDSEEMSTTSSNIAINQGGGNNGLDTNTIIMIGSVAGGLLICTLIILLLVCYRKNKKLANELEQKSVIIRDTSHAIDIENDGIITTPNGTAAILPTNTNTANNIVKKGEGNDTIDIDESDSDKDEQMYAKGNGKINNIIVSPGGPINIAGDTPITHDVNTKSINDKNNNYISGNSSDENADMYQNPTVSNGQSTKGY